MSPAPAIRTRATTAPASATPDPASDPGCDPEHAEPRERFWDGTGRTEAVRGA